MMLSTDVENLYQSCLSLTLWNLKFLAMILVISLFLSEEAT